MVGLLRNLWRAVIGAGLMPCVVFWAFSLALYAQNVGIGEPTPVYKLDIDYSGVFYGFQLERSDVARFLRVGMNTTYTEYYTNNTWHRFLRGSNTTKVGGIMVGTAGGYGGRIRFYSSLEPGGNPGVSGEVLVSQGAGNAPQWQPVENLVFPTNVASISLASNQQHGDNPNWENLLTLNFTAKTNRAFVIFTASGYGCINWNGIVQFRILNNGSSVGATSTKVNSEYDVGFNSYQASQWSVAYSRVITGLIPGNNYTVTVQWKVDPAPGSGYNCASIEPVTYPDYDHATLSVMY